MEHIPVAAAVAKVMTEVRRLEKADKNTHANYKFTSVDDFKDALRPLMAKHGLTVRCDQTGFDTRMIPSKTGETLVARFDFEFVMATATDTDAPERSTVMLPYTGAQTTGIARSYALKEYLKTRLMASSGDEEDADRLPTGEYGNAKPAPKAASRSTYSELQESLRGCSTREDVLKWAAEHAPQIDTLPNDWRQTLRDETKSLLKELA